MPAEPLSTGEHLTVLHGPRLAGSALLTALAERGVISRMVESPDELGGSSAAVLLLDKSLLDAAPLESWQQKLNDRNPDCQILAEASIAGEGVDLAMPAGISTADSVNIIRLALSRWVLQRENRQLQAVLDKTEHDLQLLTEIGIALSAERDLNRLLDKILAEAQNLACCDAASLFLVEKRDDAASVLTFKLTRNDSIEADFREQTMELDPSSIAGYVAINDMELNIPNVYDIASTELYSFNPDFDRKTGYRTVSLLALPVRNYRGEVIGVLQFINRKTRRSVRLDSQQAALTETLPFNEGQIKILRALASQSAVAIENSVLLEDINNLFSGFVQAAVAAIEQRDPSTSGHSFRVADLTTQMAVILPQANIPEYRGVHFGDTAIKELRYAALLHDFGKVGVREHILVKAKKLPDKHFELVRYRVRLAQETVRRQAGEQVLEAWQRGADAAAVALLREAAQRELDRLEQYLRAIEQANEPTVLQEGDFNHLREIREYSFRFEDEGIDSLISDEEFSRLSVRRGSLTPEEREEIESHVVHTANFLRLIPWTPELAGIPDLAEAHHEKLDGTGYPLGRHADEIPLGSKLMAICDIYDALTASDRPYKSAVPREKAFSILEQEAAAGKLHQPLVDLFIAADVPAVLVGKEYPAAAPVGPSNHPCDPEFHEHAAS